ncbi:hypothetical protein HOK51_08400 [Candidatus Woesearchaeota archaeon]|jgi:hypothetical protein|nr:hypothetical protein [Candidatus Woesearchaeota archaeon]MBT6519846.1 hypothetical protein [Candidatus Woesearchaeota archaeon]MBT7367138.1 hypothetical protein [Candidatus Woesearchaeota archaeon]
MDELNQKKETRYIFAMTASNFVMAGGAGYAAMGGNGALTAGLSICLSGAAVKYGTPVACKIRDAFKRK